jgi:hypothetical protein
MKRISVRVVLGFVGALAAVYAVDWGVLQVRVARQTAFSTVQVDQFIAASIKGNKQDYYDAGTATETCVRAIFPHASNPPCWWLKRHTTQWRIVGALVGDLRAAETDE